MVSWDKVGVIVLPHWVCCGRLVVGLEDTRAVCVGLLRGTRWRGPATTSPLSSADCRDERGRHGVIFVSDSRSRMIRTLSVSMKECKSSKIFFWRIVSNSRDKSIHSILVTYSYRWHFAASHRCPDASCSFQRQLDFYGKHTSSITARRLFVHTHTTAYSQLLIYTTEWTGETWSKRNCRRFEMTAEFRVLSMF